MIANICPVCGQSGLKDYNTQHIVCPQCDSDLKPYLLLNSISKGKGSERAIYLSLVVLGIALITLLGLYLVNHKKNKDRLEKYSVDIAVLEDSIKRINTENSIQITEANKEIQKNTILYKYTVKKGDHLWKLAEFFYGDGKLYTQIEKDNNLTKPYTIYVGQEININLIVK